MNKTVIQIPLLLLTYSLFGQTPGTGNLASPTAGNLDVISSGIRSDLSAASTGGINSSIPENTNPKSNRVPLKSVDLSLPSGLELMYRSYAINLGRSADASQFGYGTFVGIPVAEPTRGRVPEPYVLGPGDAVTILLWGDPIDNGELRAEYSTKVQSDGTIFFPPVGNVLADGLLRTDVEKTLISGLSKKYKRFELRLKVTTSRVFTISVIGNVASPGAVTVDPWTDITQVLLEAGGVEKSGTLRNVQLVKSDGRSLTLDLYGILLTGKTPQAKLEEGDVVFVGPVGRTVSIQGSVNTPGIYELLPNETFRDAMKFCGGVLPSALGAPLVHLKRNEKTIVQSEAFWSQSDFSALDFNDGDAFFFDGHSDATRSPDKPGLVKVVGEVRNPGYFEWTPGMTLAAAIQESGGLLPTGYAVGLVLTRDSVVPVQQAQIRLALETNQAQILALESKLKTTTDQTVLAALSDELSARQEAGVLLRNQLNGGGLGRVQIGEGTRPETVLLEPGDSIRIPREDGSLLIIGEVLVPGAQIWKKGLTVRQALSLVGGMKDSADEGSVYVIRASGLVESVSSRMGFLWMSSLWGELTRPGDIIYVPTKKGSGAAGWALTKDIVGLLAQSTTAVMNVFVTLKTVGAI